ncbi:unnamed protein product, partial [Prorocentrum cordatum]
VAALSGLARPRELRQLAVAAFQSINCYTAEELQGRYREFLAYLDDAQVTWIRCRYPRQIARQGSPLWRCQAVLAAEGEVADLGPAVGPLAASDDDAVFIDWMGLPQHDGQGSGLQRMGREGQWPQPGKHPAVRTESAEAAFQK